MYELDNNQQPNNLFLANNLVQPNVNDVDDTQPNDTDENEEENYEN